MQSIAEEFLGRGVLSQSQRACVYVSEQGPAEDIADAFLDRLGIHDSIAAFVVGDDEYRSLELGGRRVKFSSGANDGDHHSDDSTAEPSSDSTTADDNDNQNNNQNASITNARKLKEGSTATTCPADTFFKGAFCFFHDYEAVTMDALELVSSKMQSEGILLIAILMPPELQRIFDEYNKDLGYGSLLARYPGYHSDKSTVTENTATSRGTDYAKLEEAFEAKVAEIRAAVADEAMFAGVSTGDTAGLWHSAALKQADGRSGVTEWEEVLSASPDDVGGNEQPVSVNNPPTVPPLLGNPNVLEFVLKIPKWMNPTTEMKEREQREAAERQKKKEAEKAAKEMEDRKAAVFARAAKRAEELEAEETKRKAEAAQSSAQSPIQKPAPVVTPGPAPAAAAAAPVVAEDKLPKEKKSKKKKKGVAFDVAPLPKGKAPGQESCSTAKKACPTCNCGRKEKEEADEETAQLEKEAAEGKQAKPPQERALEIALKDPEILRMLEEAKSEMAQVEIIQRVRKEIQAKDSSCGSCYLGDAFRCASCPSTGMPAFEKAAT